MISELDKLLSLIEQQLDWGSSESWKSRDFEKLNLLILEKTSVSLSASTLRRLWGRVKYTNLPSAVTLDTMACFAGFSDWRTYLKENTGVLPLAAEMESSVPDEDDVKTSWRGIAVIVSVLVLIGMLGFYLLKQPIAMPKTGYTFNSRKITTGIPNSVVFDYDISAAPTSANYIQQSWDSGTRALISKNDHQYTSIYYEPGFYKAKLLVGNQIVQEHELLIPTIGWLGYINRAPIPVYLDSADFQQEDRFEFPLEKIRRRGIDLSVKLPEVTYANVGGFDPVPLGQLQFSCELKNGYKSGIGACQKSSILLMTSDEPILIPMSSPGCSAALNLMSAGEFISGKTTDLSGFTADMLAWNKIECRIEGKELVYRVNGKLAYHCALPAKQMYILGLSFTFEGTGAVRAIQLNNRIIRRN